MLESFSIIFLSILLEALPFVILGTIISSIIEVFVTPEWISSKIKNNSMGYYLVAASIGLIFPVCECAIVPIMRRLVKKGVPLGLAITFMLSTPILNPVVLLSTYYAFSSGIKMALLRGAFGFIGAILIGKIINLFDNKDVLLDNEHNHNSCIHDDCHCHHNHEEDACCNHNDPEHHHSDSKSVKSTIIQLLNHTSSEIIDVSRFLILGALIASAMQSFIPHDVFLTFTNNPVISIVVMMILAFVLSLCSEADAFIAATFKSIVPEAAILGFLIYGPMIDIKNTLMLLSSFKAKFVIRLISIITIICFILALIATIFI